MRGSFPRLCNDQVPKIALISATAPILSDAVQVRIERLDFVAVSVVSPDVRIAVLLRHVNSYAI